MFWTFCGKCATDLSNLQSLCTEETYLINFLFVLRVNDLRKIGDFFLAGMSTFHSNCQDEVWRINKNFRAKQNSSSIDLGNPVEKNFFRRVFSTCCQKRYLHVQKKFLMEDIIFWKNYLFFRCLSFFAENNLETWRSCFVQS